MLLLRDLQQLLDLLVRQIHELLVALYPRVGNGFRNDCGVFHIGPNGDEDVCGVHVVSLGDFRDDLVGEEGGVVRTEWGVCRYDYSLFLAEFANICLRAGTSVVESLWLAKAARPF